MMKISILFICMLFFVSFSFTQEKTSFSKTIKLNDLKSKDIHKQIVSWFDGQTRFRSLQEENKTGIIVGKGSFPYKTSVQFEGSQTFSKYYAERVNGIITYKVKIWVIDYEYTYEFTDFQHIPSDKSDNICLGFLTNDSVIPSTVVCEVTGDWCNLVWLDFKKQVEKQINEIAATIPLNTNQSK